MAFSLPWNYTHILFTPKYQNSGITVLSDQARYDTHSPTLYICLGRKLIAAFGHAKFEYVLFCP